MSIALFITCMVVAATMEYRAHAKPDPLYIKAMIGVRGHALRIVESEASAIIQKTQD